MIPFTGNPLDPASARRADADWIAARWRDPASRALPVWRDMPLVRGPVEGPLAAAFVPPAVAAARAPDASCVFLGLEDGTAMFALEMPAAGEPDMDGLGRFAELRGAAALLPARDLAILGRAKALVGWHARHGFCAQCGARTAPAEGGSKRICPTCGAEHFPRTDPVVIMLVTDGEACLLGRGARFPAGRYSALAGFVEPGETVEEAVAREVFEEVGVRVADVRYHASQPWPFPSALMIGCFAEARSRDLVLDAGEMADARWFAKETVRALLAGKIPEGLPEAIHLPPAFAIARHLIAAWASA